MNEAVGDTEYTERQYMTGGIKHDTGTQRESRRAHETVGNTEYTDRYRIYTWRKIYKYTEGEYRR